MRFAIVQDGKCVNVSIADEEYGLSQGWIASDSAEIGDLVDGNGNVTKPPPAPPKVPQEVGRWKARQILIDDGLMETVKLKLAALPANKREQAINAFDHRPTWRRSSELVDLLGKQIPLTDAQMDDLFIRADSLS
jgi:hypothetical protein